MKMIDNFTNYMDKQSLAFMATVTSSIVLIGIIMFMCAVIFFPITVMVICIVLPFVIVIGTFIIAQIDAQVNKDESS